MRQLIPKKTSIQILTVLACLFYHTSSFSQVITTYAGSGFNGETGDGGPAKNAGIVYPSDICLDKDGNLYIVGTNKVRKVNASTGIITTVAGTGAYDYSGDGGPATNASLKYTSGVFVDDQYNIYISEYGGHRIRKVNGSTGIITTIAGTGVAGYSGDGGPAAAASINTPQSVCVDKQGNVYFADYYNSRVRKIDATTGVITTVAGTGSTSHSGDGGLASAAGVPYPNSITLDNKGYLYIVEVNNTNTCRVRKVNISTGIIQTIAGYSSYAHSGDGGLAIHASLFDPHGVSVDPQGNVYIAQYDDSRIRKIDAATGIISTIAGVGVNGFAGDCGAPASAQLHYPMGIAIDTAGNLYIADNTNHRIRKVVQGVTLTSTTQVKVCASAFPYQWNGQTITAAGTYTAKPKPVTQSICDSIATLVVGVESLLNTDTTITVCSNELPFHWKGLTLNAEGTYTATLKAQTGCDTLAHLTLKVNSLSLSISNTSTTCGTATGSATIAASGLAPYTYAWSTIPVQNTAMATGLPAGSYSVRVTDANGCVQTASTTIAVSSVGQGPVIKCPADTTYCNVTSNTYTVEKLVVTSACGIAGVSYKISGATSREGNGNDASGSFNPGASIITWTVKDIYNNQSTCQTKITINAPLAIDIADAKALPQGVLTNTAYVGYKRAASLRLSVSNNETGYTYLWNNGEKTASITVAPVAPTSYQVMIRDKMGCTKTVSKTIQVVDVRCGHNFDKVMICQVPPGNPEKETRICIDSSAVAAHLEKGSYLGMCNNEAPALEARVFANPSNTAFSITVQSISDRPVELKLLDQNGKVMEARTGIPVNTLISIGGDLQPGFYFLEVLQDGKRSSIKLIKQ